jgi:hypothetical protein
MIKISYAKVLKALLEGPCTTHDLVEVSGIHLVTTQSLMRTFHRHKIVHIVAWEADRLGRDTTAVFKLGEGRNKARHKFTAAERQARCQAKKQRNLLTIHSTIHITPDDA